MTPFLNTLGQYESENKGRIWAQGLRKDKDHRLRETSGNTNGHGKNKDTRRKYRIGAINTSYDVSPRDRRFRSAKREEGPRASHYHPRHPAFLEPKLEYPRSRNIDYIAQEPEYGAHEEFEYRERKNNARMEQYGNSYDKPHKYTPAELFYRAPEPDSPARQKVRDLAYIKREPEYLELTTTVRGRNRTI